MQKYGIHGMREEHFGDGPGRNGARRRDRLGAERWWPDRDGQAPLLRYDSEQQAAEQIVAVMRDAGRQNELRAHPRKMGESLGVDRFVRAIQSLVANFEP